MSVRIIHGDCRDILPTLHGEQIDACTTDPVWPNCPPDLLEGWDSPDFFVERPKPAKQEALL